MRMGTADLDTMHFNGSMDRRVSDLHVHPNYKPGQAYYDIGIAEAETLITFSEYVMPVCLPYLPIDDANHIEDQFVTLAGWGYNGGAKVELELTSHLKIRSLRVKL